MLIALCFGFDLSRPGQTWTQTLQPVQSSGATWIVYFIPGCSRDLKSCERNVIGAAASASGS